MSQKSLNQHYVAQSYLRNFANTKGQIKVFDKVTGEEFTTNVRNVASERGFNDYSDTLDSDKPELFQFYERRLSEFEEKAGRVVGKIIEIAEKQRVSHYSDFRTVPIRQRKNIALILCMQMLRTRTSREFLRDLYSKLGSCLMRATARDLAPDIDAADLDMNYDDDYIRKQHLEGLFELSRLLAKGLLSRLFYIGINPSSIQLWTSDNPVVLDCQRIQNVVPYDGIKSPGIKIVYPLSPRVAAIFIDPFRFSHLQCWESKFKVLTKKEVLRFNELQVKQSCSRVFSNGASFNRARMILTENLGRIPTRQTYNLYPHLEQEFVRQWAASAEQGEIDQMVSEIRRRLE